MNVRDHVFTTLKGKAQQMGNNTPTCFIWGTPVTDLRSDPLNKITTVIGSRRTGGDYEITAEAIDLGNVGDLEPIQKAKLTTVLIEMRKAGDHAPRVTCDLVEKAKNASPLPVYVRAERLLRYLVNSTTWVGHVFRNNIVFGDPEALAWSESTLEQDIPYFVNYLTDTEWLKSYQSGSFTIAVPGYQHVAEQTTKKDLSQCFVAMWFDPTMGDAYEKGIKQAVEECGYKPLPINKKPDVIKIDDEIIAEIRRSRFVVADFTHDKEKGDRGGVYFEAGFAHGLELPVIYTCREDLKEDLHFDTRQYYHILWKTEEDLRDELKKRILAIVGEGPKAGASPAAL